MAQVSPLATPMVVVVSRSGPRHEGVSPRGESKSAAPPPTTELILKVPPPHLELIFKLSLN